MAEPRLFLDPAEVAFLAAAADTLIPADALSPAASECGVVDFIDRELAGPYGQGARLYSDGPVAKGEPEHGYQLALTPRELFRAGIAAADQWARAVHGKNFDRLQPEARDAALHAMAEGRAEFAGLDARAFFEALYAVVMEGFFADPIHGGNRGMAGWKMLSYPGLPADYRDRIASESGKKVALAPRSIADLS